MPPRKKVTGVLTGVGENHRLKPSANHISMHSEGTKSSKEVSHTKNRNIMAAIEDLQRSQAAMEDISAILFEAKKLESAVYVDTRLSHPTNYTPPIFPKYDGMIGNAREHIRREELYNILEAWLKDGVVVLPECKREPTEEEKRSPLYCRYHRRCDHHTMDCYALRNIFHNRIVKGDLDIKDGKKANPRMCRPEVAMTFFMGREDPMEEEVGNMASSSSTPSP
nr:hypothetical protein CFP56_14272 [Quercus suber]